MEINKELCIKTLVMIYTITGAIFISKHIQDSCDVFVVGLHVLAAYLYTKEVIRLTNIKNYFKRNKVQTNKIKLELFEEKTPNINQELQLTSMFRK